MRARRTTMPQKQVSEGGHGGWITRTGDGACAALNRGDVPAEAEAVARTRHAHGRLARVRHDQGFTMVELLAVMVILGLVMTGIIALYLSGIRAQASLT